MTSVISAPKRIIAVKPGMQYLGVAILEDEDLIGYSIKTFPGRKSMPHRRLEVQQYLTKVLDRYAPSVLAVEEPFNAQSLQSESLTKIMLEIKNWGRWKGLGVHSYTAQTVKAFFCRDAKTKQSVAEAMIAQYPFLSRYL